MTPMQKAVFLDRDGTVTQEVGYVNHVERLKLLPGAAAAIANLNRAGILAILATNQAGVARGYFPEELVVEVHKRLENLLAAEGAHLDAIYYCPHHPSVGPPPYRQNCQCRKPEPGMLLMAAKKFNLDLNQCFMIGDKITDSLTGQRVGAKGIMVLTGYGRGEYIYQRSEWKEEPDFIAPDLGGAVDWILKQCSKRKGA